MLETQRRSLAQTALREAERALESEHDPDKKNAVLWQLARTQIALDRAWAKRTLEQGWQVSLKIKEPNARSRAQVDLVLYGWAGLDIAKAKALTQKIQDSYWRDFATTKLAQNVAGFDIAQAVPLLRAIPDDMDREREVMEASYDIMNEDPERAVRLIQAVPNVDQDGLIHGVIANVARSEPTEARRLLRHLKSPAERKKAYQSLAEALTETQPMEALEYARNAQGNWLSKTFAALAVVLGKRNRAKALEAVELALAALPKPSEQEDRFRQATWIAPMIGEVNAEKARQLLNSLKVPPKGNPNRLLDLASAWARLDLPKANAYYESAVKQDSRIAVDPHGQFLDGTLTYYLAGLALSDPKKAVERLRFHQKKVSYGSLTEDKILELLMRLAPQKALAFGEALEGAAGRQQVEKRLLIRRIRSNPERDEVLLSKVVQEYVPLGNHDMIAQELALRYTHTDLPHALRLIRQIRDPKERVRGMCGLAEALFRVGKPTGIACLAEAYTVAQQCKPGSERADALSEVADSALFRIRGQKG